MICNKADLDAYINWIHGVWTCASFIRAETFTYRGRMMYREPETQRMPATGKLCKNRRPWILVDWDHVLVAPWVVEDLQADEPR